MSRLPGKSPYGVSHAEPIEYLTNLRNGLRHHVAPVAERAIGIDRSGPSRPQVDRTACIHGWHLTRELGSEEPLALVRVMAAASQLGILQCGFAACRVRDNVVELQKTPLRTASFPADERATCASRAHTARFTAAGMWREFFDNGRLRRGLSVAASFRFSSDSSSTVSAWSKTSAPGAGVRYFDRYRSGTRSGPSWQ